MSLSTFLDQLFRIPNGEVVLQQNFSKSIQYTLLTQFVFTQIHIHGITYQTSAKMNFLIHHSFSLWFNGHFSKRTWVSQYQNVFILDLLEQRLSNHYHQQTNTQLFYRPDALSVAQPTVSKH